MLTQKIKSYVVNTEVHRTKPYKGSKPLITTYVGHIFRLGTKYSKSMDATFNIWGEEKPLVMGCYGIGVSRLVQAVVEQSHDKDGIIWPISIAPYHVIIVIPDMSNESQVTIAKFYIMNYKG